MTGSIMLHNIVSVNNVRLTNQDGYQTLTIDFTDKQGNTNDVSLFSLDRQFMAVNLEITEKDGDTLLKFKGKNND